MANGRLSAAQYYFESFTIKTTSNVKLASTPKQEYSYDLWSECLAIPVYVSNSQSLCSRVNLFNDSQTRTKNNLSVIWTSRCVADHFLCVLVHEDKVFVDARDDIFVVVGFSNFNLKMISLTHWLWIEYELWEEEHIYILILNWDLYLILHLYKTDLFQKRIRRRTRWLTA